MAQAVGLGQALAGRVLLEWSDAKVGGAGVWDASGRKARSDRDQHTGGPDFRGVEKERVGTHQVAEATGANFRKGRKPVDCC